MKKIFAIMTALVLVLFVMITVKKFDLEDLYGDK
jgi:hypothetical protein